MLPGGVGGTPRGARRPRRRARDPRDHRPPRAARRRRAARRLAPASRPRASRWPGDRTGRWPPSCTSRRSATSTRRSSTRDPVGRAWVDHMAAVPPRDGDRVLTMRRWLGRDSGEMLSPAVGVCWLDVKRTYMELRPRLSRLYSAMADPAALAPIFAPLGFAPAGPPVDVGGGVLHQPVWLDFGEGSVDGWLRRLVGGEITGEEAAAAELAEGAAGARLTPRETEVLGADRGRPLEPRDRGPPRHQREDRRAPRGEHLLQARGAHPRAGRGRRGEDGAFARWRGGRARPSVGPDRTDGPSAIEEDPMSRADVEAEIRDTLGLVPTLLVGRPRHPDRERVGQLHGHRARRDPHPEQVQGAHRRRRLRRHALPVLRPLPQRGRPPVRRDRRRDRRGLAHGEAHHGLEHVPQRHGVRLRRVRRRAGPDHGVRPRARLRPAPAGAG